MLPLCLDAAVSRGILYVLVNVHLLLNRIFGITSASLHSVYFVSQWTLPAMAADSQSESQRALHNVGHAGVGHAGHNQLQAQADGSSRRSNDIVDKALESLSSFWKLRDQDIPEHCAERFIRERLPLHQMFPMPIALKIMKYMETRRHVEQTKAAIGKIDEAIRVMVELRHDAEGYHLRYDLSYENSLRLFKVRLQEYNTEPLAAQSSGDVYRSLSKLATDFHVVKIASRPDAAQSSADPFHFFPPQPRMHCCLQRLQGAKNSVRVLLLEQIYAMMSGSVQSFYYFFLRG